MYKIVGASLKPASQPACLPPSEHRTILRDATTGTKTRTHGNRSPFPAVLSSSHLRQARTVAEIGWPETRASLSSVSSWRTAVELGPRSLSSLLRLDRCGIRVSFPHGVRPLLLCPLPPTSARIASAIGSTTEALPPLLPEDVPGNRTSLPCRAVL